MTERETCETCRFNDELVCKRYPPQMILWPQDNQHPIMYAPTGTQPAISLGMWCGEHKPREAKP